jgi:hypothetical protein
VTISDGITHPVIAEVKVDDQTEVIEVNGADLILGNLATAKILPPL